MKKNNLSYVSTGILLVTLSLVSCSKSFLEKAPINVPTDINFWQNEAEATSSVAGAYGLLRVALNEMGSAYYYYGDIATDEFIARTNGEDYPALTQIQWQTYVAPSQTFRGLIKLRRWDNFYKGIDQANRCLQFIPPIPLDKFTSANKEAAKNTLIGEAYFLRAFNYFYMSRVWGDVPLITESVLNAVEAPNPARTPQAEVLDQCIKDLQEAIKLLTYSGASVNRPIRANKGTCFALLAHIYAWKGEYDKVVPNADSVITNGGYTHVSRSIRQHTWVCSKAIQLKVFSRSRRTQILKVLTFRLIMVIS